MIYAVDKIWMVMLLLLTNPLPADNQHIHIPESTRVETLISVNAAVHAMELDMYITDNILFAEASKLMTTAGQTTSLISGSNFTSEDDYAEGIGSAAKYSHMISFIQLSASHVLVIDRWNHCLRLVDRFSRQSSLFLGNCTGPAGHRNGVNPLFSFPWSAVKYIREDDKLLLTEWGNRAVRIIHIKTKRVETLIKSDRLIRMRGLAQDKTTGDLFIVYSHGVMKYFMSDKSLTALTGSTQAGFADGSLQDARFNHPNAILILSPGKFLLTDFDNQRLRRIDLDVNTADSICSGRRDEVDGNLTSCQLSHPNSLLRVDDTIYIGTGTGIRILQAAKLGLPSQSPNIVTLIPNSNSAPTTTVTPISSTQAVHGLQVPDIPEVTISLSVAAGCLLMILLIVLLICAIRRGSSKKRKDSTRIRILPYAEASLERAGEAPELPERLQPSQLTCHPAEVDTSPTGHTDRGVYLKSNQQESEGYFEVLPNQEESYYSTCGRAEEMVYERTAVNYVTDAYYSANTGAEETVNIYDRPTINYVSDAYYTGVQLSPQ